MQKMEKQSRNIENTNEGEEWKFNMHQEQQGDRERGTDKEDEAEDRLEVKFKCQPSIQLHNGQNSSNGLRRTRVNLLNWGTHKL